MSLSRFKSAREMSLTPQLPTSASILRPRLSVVLAGRQLALGAGGLVLTPALAMSGVGLFLEEFSGLSEAASGGNHAAGMFPFRVVHVRVVAQAHRLFHDIQGLTVMKKSMRLGN